MDVELTACLGNIQGILEEFVDGSQRLLIEVVRRLVREDLLDEHLAERNRKLINQPSDSKLAVGNDILLLEENLAHVERHPRLLVGTADFLDLSHRASVGDMDRPVVAFRQRGDNGGGDIRHLLRAVLVAQLLDDDDGLLVHRRDEVVLRLGEQALHRFQCTVVLALLGFKNIDDPLHIRRDVKPLGTIIYINQQQVVKQQVLDEVVLVKVFLVGNQQILDLERGQLAHHERLLASGSDDDVLQLIVVVDLKVPLIADLLGISLRVGKADDIRTVHRDVVSGRRHYLAVQVDDGQFTFCDRLDSVYGILQHKIR